MQYLYTLAIFCIFYSIDLKSFSMAVLSMMITMRKRDSFLYLNVGHTDGHTDTPINVFLDWTTHFSPE